MNLIKKNYFSSFFANTSLYTWLVSIVTLLVAGVLLQVLTNDLVWDDPYLISEVPQLGKPSELWNMLTVPFWQNSSFTSSQLIDLWRPLTTFFLWSGAFLWGTSPIGFHALSLLSLVSASVMFAKLLIKILPDKNGSQIALAIALLFSIHPLSVEVLCMTANMSDHLAFTFMVAQIIVILNYLIKPEKKLKLIWISLLCFMACCSKELGVLSVGAPLVAWMLRKSLNASFNIKLLKDPLLWLATILPIIIYLALRTVVINYSGSTLPFAGDKEFTPIVIFLGFGQALYHSVIPVPAGVHDYISPANIAVWALSIATIALLGLIIVLGNKNKKLISLQLTGFLLALIVLIPSLVGIENFDLGYRFPTRYFHLSLAGFLIATLPFISKHWTHKINLAVILLIALLSLLSFVRINEWQDNISLFSAEIIYHPNSSSDYINLSQAMIHKKAFTSAEKIIVKLDKQPIVKSPAIIAQRNSTLSRIALQRDGDTDKATWYIKKAIKDFPANLYFVSQLAVIRAHADHPEQSIIILTKALNAPWFIDFQKKDIEDQLKFYQNLVIKKQTSKKQSNE